VLVALALALALAFGRAAVAQESEPDIERFFAVVSLDTEVAREAQQEIAASWRDGYALMFVDMIDVLSRTGFVDPRGFVQLARLTQFLERQTGQSFGSDIASWRRWAWSLPYEPHPEYGAFKGTLLARLDPRFAAFFAAPVEASIRLDEIEWGGVGVNGIPPLDHPKLLPAEDAAYLDAGDIVFGLTVAGEARAYPKRILAWHELALDTLGDRELAVVYCTLCGTVIPFDAELGGAIRTFGTGGLLYRSNKLMFDAGTKSLWSSLTGEPVVGPLTGSGLRLEALPVVTTTWGEWRSRHPETTVLSLDTGFARDYSEGAAYRAYFATDELMFDVALRDGRLPNKAEVLVVRSLGGNSGPGDGAAEAAPSPVAIETGLLDRHPVYRTGIDGVELVILTSGAGANRVYLADGFRFDRLADESHVLDADGRRWKIDETALVAEFAPGISLPRVAAHRAFWFGWYAQHPDTALIR